MKTTIKILTVLFAFFAIRANAEQYTNKVLVATSIEEILPYENLIKNHKKVGIVVQTTQMLSTLNTIVNYINSIAKEVLIHNTICQSTAKRQAAILSEDNAISSFNPSTVRSVPSGFKLPEIVFPFCAF